MDHSQRVVNPSSNGHNGVNANAVNDALAASDKKKKMKAVRRSDSSASGGSRSRSHTKELALPPDDSLMCAPSFMSGLKPDLDASDGERLELRVQVKGDPDPQVTWTKDGKPLVSSTILEVKYKNGVASVTVNEMFPEDAGHYKCRASNTKGAVETSSKVKVVAAPKAPKAASNGKAANGKAASSAASAASSSVAPRIYKHTGSKIVKDGEPVKLECTIAGDTRFDVVWLHNEKEIKPNKDFLYKSAANTHILEIAEIFPEDAGTYTCEAFNDIGECFSSCTLDVEVPGEPVVGVKMMSFPQSATVDRSASASFLAEVTSLPKKVTWMKDGKEVKELPMKVKLTHNKKIVGLDVMDCGQSDAGQYAVIVEGEKGEEVKAAFSLNVNV